MVERSERRMMAKSLLPRDSLVAILPVELSLGLFANSPTLSLAADQTLFSAGDEGDGCYWVDEGLLKASVTASTGGERIVAIFGPGSVVGELSMIVPWRSKATSRGVGDIHEALQRFLKPPRVIDRERCEN